MRRPAPRAPLVGALLAAAVALPGCATERRSGASVREAALAAVTVDPSSPWTEREAAPPIVGIHRPERSWTVNSADGAAPDSRSGTAARSAPPVPPVPPAPRAPLPIARGLGEVPAKGAPPLKSLEDTARERFLDHPTEVRADSLTLVLPARLVAEVRLTGSEVTEPGAGRRIAVGAARLTCRELTLVGDKITLRTRPPGSEDVQITARGGVSFVSRQRDQVLREEGVQTLLVTNDAVTPLR